METLPFPKNSMIGPPIGIGDEFYACNFETPTEGLIKKYRVVGEEGKNWLAVKVDKNAG